MSQKLGRVSEAPLRLAEWLRSLDRSGIAQKASAEGDYDQPAAWEQVGRTKWQRRLRFLLVLATAGLLAVQATLLVDDHDVVVGVALGLAAAHVLCAPMALVQPVVAAGLSLVMVTAQALVMMPGGAPGWPLAVAPQVVTQLLVLLVLTLTAGWRLAGGTVLLQVLSGVVLAVVGVGWNPLGPSLGYVALFASLSLLVGSLALVSGRLAESRQALLRERTISAEEHVRRTMVEEKSRIARELHDVIAHNMSLITVQARSAPHRVGDVSEAAATEFAEIADRAAEALRQMRGVLDVLRTEPGQSGLVPVPGVDGIASLVASAGATGQEVALHGAVPTPEQVAADVGAAAYRILQEALSNARRHAPEAPVRIDVRLADEVLELRVANPVVTEAGVGADGHGVLGMRQRAASVGGVVRAGTAHRDGSTGSEGSDGSTGSVAAVEYVVTARLPAQGSPTTREEHT